MNESVVTAVRVRLDSFLNRVPELSIPPPSPALVNAPTTTDVVDNSFREPLPQAFGARPPLSQQIGHLIDGYQQVAETECLKRKMDPSNLFTRRYLVGCLIAGVGLSPLLFFQATLRPGSGALAGLGGVLVVRLITHVATKLEIKRRIKVVNFLVKDLCAHLPETIRQSVPMDVINREMVSDHGNPTHAFNIIRYFIDPHLRP